MKKETSQIYPPMWNSATDTYTRTPTTRTYIRTRPVHSFVADNCIYEQTQNRRTHKQTAFFDFNKDIHETKDKCSAFWLVICHNNVSNKMYIYNTNLECRQKCNKNRRSIWLGTNNDLHAHAQFTLLFSISLHW